MSDLAAQLRLLRQQYDATTDPALRAAFATAIDAMERSAQLTGGNSQDVGDNTNIGVNVVGNVNGHVFLNGYRERSREELLAAYLGRLAERCAVMPLQGVANEREANDTLRLGLDQIYTQLATTALTPRELYTGQALRTFNAKNFLGKYTGMQLLPKQRRTQLHAMYADIDGDLLLDAHAGQSDIRSSGGDNERVFERFDTLASPATLHQLRKAERVTAFGPQLVIEAIAAHPHLVLLGEPGSGKSTALRYLARGLARAGIEQGYDLAQQIDGWGNLGHLLPLFAPLLPLARTFATASERRGTAADLWNYLVDQLQPKGVYNGLAEAVMDEIDAGHTILLFDGLDEVAGSATRRQVVEAIRAFAEEHTRCRVVVSCRIRAYDDQINPENRRWQLSGWPTATLADLTPAQMEHFVGTWYGAVAATDSVIAAQRDARSTELRAALNARPDLRTLGARPLLLTIMALVHLRQRNLPEDRASLYRECVEILLARWELRGKEETEYKALMDYIGLPGVEVKALRPLLAKAALTAHTASQLGGLGLLNSAELQVIVQQFLAQKQHPDPYHGALRFLEYTDYRAGLLHATGARNDYQFAHMTFQEYLAGLALIGDERPVQAMLAKRTDERWRLPIFLGIGHAVSEGLPSLFGDLLDELIGAPTSERDAQGQLDLILAADLAEDVHWERFPGAGFARRKQDLAQGLSAVLARALLPAGERVRAGQLLARLGDPRRDVVDLPPTMHAFAGGTFFIGSTPEETAEDDEINQQETTVSPFLLARYPVTNAQYALFIADSGYNPDALWWNAAGKAWLLQNGGTKRQPRYWNDSRFGIQWSNQPVVGVTWYEAMAFCRWLSQHANYNPHGYRYRLPSEAEWEYAARGSERRICPWGAAPPNDEQANYNQTFSGTTAVGCFPLGATPEGLLDIAGNVWEWTRSNYAPYPYDATDGREDVDEVTKKRFTLRGGSWYNRPAYLFASYRLYDAPENDGNDLGFRLARHGS